MSQRALFVLAPLEAEPPIVLEPPMLLPPRVEPLFVLLLLPPIALLPVPLAVLLPMLPLGLCALAAIAKSAAAVAPTSNFKVMSCSCVVVKEDEGCE